MLTFVPCRPRSGRARATAKAPAGLSAAPQKDKSFEEDFWENYKPPSYARNKYVWAAALILGFIAAYYSTYYKDCIPL